MTLTDHDRALPAAVITRCGSAGAFHGASASGLRLPTPTDPDEAQPVDQVAESLADLAEDMRQVRDEWLAHEGQEETS
jgi:hypothetical protein